MAERLDNAPCGFVEFLDNGRIVYANDTLAGWIGVPVEELPGRKFESLLTVANRVFFQTHLFPMLTLHRRAEEIFLALRHVAGSPVPVVAAAVRIDTAESPLNRCAFVTVHQRRRYEDEILAARRAAEEALRNSEELQRTKRDLEQRGHELERRLREVQARNEELQRVIQVLSHDLREPIRKIALFAEIVREKTTALDEEGAAALQRVNGEAARMEELLRAMRQFLEVNGSGPAETIDLKTVFENAVTAISLRLGFNDWSIECEPLPPVEGWRALLQLLFLHLVENAVKFRDPSRRLRIALRGRVVQENRFSALPGRYEYVDFLQLEFADNGRGFDRQYRDYIFQFLRKVELNSPGLGIGLAICRKIAAFHFGSIRADSTPGLGATFTLLLPLRQ